MSDNWGFGGETALKRDVPRQFTAWRGRYLLQGDSSQHWAECRVVDISSTGAGLLLPRANARETERRELLLNLTFQARVKHAENTEAGLRAGVEFLNVSEAERAELRALAELGIRW